MPNNQTQAFGTEYTVLLAPSDTEGRLSSYVSTCPPNPGPPRHVHHREDETFFVISGTVEFWIDGQTRIISNGQAAFVPRGKEHTFHVVGPASATMLTTLTPGGFENFFFEVAAKGLSISEDMPAISQLAVQYGMDFVGPPLHAGN